MILASIRGEWFKVVRRPAMWITIALMLALSVGLEYVLVYVVAAHPPPSSANLGDTFKNLRLDLYPSALIRKTLANASGLYGIFTLIIGVLVQGSEFAWGTVKTVYAQRPGRIAIVVGQLVAIAMVSLLATVGLFAVNAATSSLLVTIDGQHSAWPAVVDLIKGIGAVWLILYLLAITGFGLATAFRQSALAIGIGIGYVLLIENLVFGLLVNLGDTFQRIRELFPIANATYLQLAFGATRAGGAASAAEATPPVDAVHSVTVIVAWLVGIAVVSSVLVRARDVK